MPGALPPAVRDLLDGHDLRRKIGHTLLLVACEPGGWPRLALLSVGEVLAVSAREVRLALYPTSGTTRALSEAGRALLVTVLEGATYKIRLEVARVDGGGSAEGAEVLFAGAVLRVDEDRVGYATVEHGIAFSLQDEDAAVDRWTRTVARMRELT